MKDSPYSLLRDIWIQRRCISVFFKNELTTFIECKILNLTQDFIVIESYIAGKGPTEVIIPYEEVAFFEVYPIAEN